MSGVCGVQNFNKGILLLKDKGFSFNNGVCYERFVGNKVVISVKRVAKKCYSYF